MGDNISQNQREKKIIQTSFVGIGGNILLVGFKAFVGIISHSVAIITDAINNLTDALSSIITIVGTKLANKKPDRKHPYGHGRIEYITSTLIAFIILFAGAMAIYESIQSLIELTILPTILKYKPSPNFTSIAALIMTNDQTLYVTSTGLSAV